MPAGVFNLVNGEGPTVGEAMSAHPDIDMMSFTGSTRGGVAVARGAAETVKRVTQELGGKSANILLDDADIARAVKGGVFTCAGNTGQSCNAPTRMLVPKDRMAEAIEAAQSAAGKIAVGDPRDEATTMGPVASEMQFDKVQGLIGKGVEEGAELVAGGPGRPEGLDKGYYVRPTVFANVSNDMTIAREEIFGPVSVDHRLFRRGRGGRHRQRHALWPVGLCLLGRSAARRPGRAPDAHRQRPYQRSHAGPFLGLRRLQAVRQRPRMGRARLRGVPGGQGDLRRRRRLTAGGPNKSEPPPHSRIPLRKEH